MSKKTHWPSFKRVTRIFKKILTPRLGILEAQLLSAISPLATEDKLESVMQKLDSMQEILVRIDSRSVERGKRQREINRQEKCFEYWEIGRNKDAIRRSANGKVTYEDVFNYFKRELSSVSVYTEAEFVELLNRRLKRLSMQGYRRR